MESGSKEEYRFEDNEKLRTYSSAPTLFIGVDTLFASYLQTFDELKNRDWHVSEDQLADRTQTANK